MTKQIPIQVIEALESMRKNTASLVLVGDIENASKMLEAIQETMKNLGLEPKDLGEATIDGLTAEERMFAAKGQLIDAIKLVRGRTGLGLKEAKDIVDNYRRKNPAENMAVNS